MIYTVSINGKQFNSIEQLETFVQSDEFRSFANKYIKHPSVHPFEVTLATVFSIVVKLEDGREVYEDFIQKSNGKQPTYEWKTSYSTVRHSGGNYADATPEQEEWIDRIKKIEDVINLRLFGEL